MKQLDTETLPNGDVSYLPDSAMGNRDTTGNLWATDNYEPAKKVIIVSAARSMPVQELCQVLRTSQDRLAVFVNNTVHHRFSAAVRDAYGRGA